VAERLNGLLLDTTVLIDLSRGLERAALWIDECRAAEAGLAISIISAMELIVGCRNQQEVLQAKSLIEGFLVLQLSPEISNHSYDWLVRYAKSHGLLIPDALIGATAAVYGLELMTSNVKDFGFLPEIVATRPY